MTREVISTDKAPAAVGPYSQAIKTEHHVYTAGQLGINPFTGKLAEGVVAQARQALANLEAILVSAGSDLDHVVKTTIFLADMGDFAEVNGIYAGYFTAEPPARSTVEVGGLPAGLLVEIEAVAAR